MILRGIQRFSGKRVLLLQGPVGPFFARLAHDLKAVGAEVFKINFNGGDWIFAPSGICFRGRIEEWPVFYEKLLESLQIDAVFLFGDCRLYHRLAHQIAEDHGIEIGVFEEGYLRPDYITLERYGVNGHSQIPRDPVFFLTRPPSRIPSSLPVGNAFPLCALWAVLYYLAYIVLWPFFRHCEHHRPVSIRECSPWLRSFARKYRFACQEHGVLEELVSSHSMKFFLVPLQVHNDAQIHVHSRYDSVLQFIRETVASFASYSPPGTLLVIKHHPMDRGYRDYSSLIAYLSKRYGVSDRVRYIHDQHLPMLLQHARGVVLINSTVGFSALHHLAPLKVCGNAFFDMPGLTYQGDLDSFWQQAHLHKVNAELFRRFRSYLIETTQLNGSFYKRLDIPGSAAGLQWDKTEASAEPGDKTSGKKLC